MNARTSLWYLVFFGFAVNYMIRMNINIAIVSMVKTKISSKILTSDVCFSQSIPQSTSNISASTLSHTRHTDDLFDWDEYEQSQALGAFYWLHWTTQLPGGILAHYYGAKHIVGLCNFLAIVLCFFVPIASYTDYRWLIFIRMLQGLITGGVWPATHYLAANWIPPHERSKFISSYLGSSIGVAGTYFICGFIIEYLGWEYVFYITGSIGVLWYILWNVLVYETPEKHPWISNKEQRYISTSLEGNVSKEKLPVPWTKILLSVPVWSTMFAQFGSAWGLFTLVTHTPTYLKAIHGLNIKMTGTFSALPYLTRFIFSYFYGGFSDYLIRKKIMSVTNVRKLATLLCNVAEGLLIFWLAFVGCDATLAVVLMMIAVTLQGAVTSGPLASLLDISPNYSGILQGLGGIISIISGLASPFIVGILTENNQTPAQWQKVFIIAAGVLFTSGMLFICFGTAELASWNSDKKKVIEEKQPLEDVKN